MTVKINAIEVASTLAHQATYDEQKDIIVDENDLFDGENYKEEHQDVFNRHYDYFFEIITNANIEDELMMVKTKKFYIHSEHTVYKDDYEEGEGDQVNNYSQKAVIEAPNIKEAIKKYFDKELFCNDYNQDYLQVDESDGKYLHYSFLVDADNSPATENEKEMWRKKEKELYSNNITLWIEGIVSLKFEDDTEKDSFPITNLTKDDLENIGYDTSNVDEATMERLASKLGDDYCEQLYWSSLPIIADHLEIPKKPKPEEDDED